MKKNYLHLKRVHKLSKGDMKLGIPLYQKMIKIQEELGEASQAFLEYDEGKNVSASASTDDKELALLEELYDTMNCTMDAINHITHKRKDLQKKMVDLCDSKLDKWERKQKVYLKDI